MIAPDTSVVIAMLASWHPAHDESLGALRGERPRLIGHVAFETVSALSRMPEGRRVVPEIVLEALERTFPDPWLSLPAEGLRDCVRRAVAGGLRGGAFYDALIAGTAARHGATLLSADRRGQGAYEAMGAKATFVAS